MSPAPAAPERLVVGHIARAHGTRGEVYVSPLTDDPQAVFAPGRELILGGYAGEADDDSPAVAVEAAREFKRGLLVKLETVDSRNAAEELAQCYLLAPLAALSPRGEGEVFYHELLGSAVETVDGQAVGTVREVYELEPAHMLEVEGADGKRHLVPFSERIVRRVDPEARRVIIDPPEGLLEI